MNGAVQALPWTAHQLDMIKGFVTVGVSIPVASEAAGLKWTTVRHWLNKGQRGIAPYTEFVDTMRKAKAMHEVGTQLIIMSAAKRGDWRAAAYLQQRRALAEERRQQRASLGDEEKVVLLYPVPMPEGAKLSEIKLPPGHAFEDASRRHPLESIDVPQHDEDDGELQ